MSALPFPCTIFKTKNRMDDYGAPDMRCGDLSESQLKTRYGLSYISDRVDPWTLTRRSAFDNPRSMFCCNMRPSGEKVTRQQCAIILFDEFHELSRQFSLYGPYRHLIEKMITHMQNNTGKPFQDPSLDKALKEQILNDRSEDNSTRILLTKALKENINWQNKNYPPENMEALRNVILRGKLPKFNRFKDNLNGMGISVHDTWATSITIKSVHINEEGYRAILHYKIQDHFGLDDNDILDERFRAFNFFRIWFFLQRYKMTGYQPFITSMEATVEISGERNAI